MFQINWKWKAFLYKIFGILRLKIIFHFIQKYVTKRSKVNIKQINKIWVYHAESIEKNNIKNILEIGAGKSLEQNIYISYRFNNSISQTAIDINQMLDFELVNQASTQIANILKQKKKEIVENLKDLKNIYNIDYIAPCDLKKIKGENRKFDMSVSTTALEHFTTTELYEYLDDLKTVLRKDGFVSAGIDYSDHYSHTDRNISNLNYLSYSKQEWEKYNNAYLYQNRLRHQNYKEIFESGSYKIKDIILGEMLTPPKKISNEFDINDKDTFVGWAYFLIVKQKN